MESESHRRQVAENSKQVIEGIAEAKRKRELERGVLRDAADMKEGRSYKQVRITPAEGGTDVHELHLTHGEDLVVPNGAYVELDERGAPKDEAVRHFLEEYPDRVTLE